MAQPGFWRFGDTDTPTAPGVLAYLYSRGGIAYLAAAYNAGLLCEPGCNDDAYEPPECRFIFGDELLDSTGNPVPGSHPHGNLIGNTRDYPLPGGYVLRVHHAC